MNGRKKKKLLFVDPLCNRHVVSAQERHSTLFCHLHIFQSPRGESATDTCSITSQRSDGKDEMSREAAHE